MKSITIIIFVLLINNSFPQSLRYSDIFSPLGFYAPCLFNNASGIGAENPASLWKFKQPAAGLRYHYDSKIQDIFPLIKMDASREFNFLPSSAGFVLPFKNVSFGFSFTQKYNLNYETNSGLGIIPDGTFTFKRKVQVYDYSLLASLAIESFSFGVKAGLSNLLFKDQVSSFSSSANVPGLVLAAGVEYNAVISKENILVLGIYYELYSEFSGSVSFNSSGGLIDIDPPGDNRKIPVNGFALKDKMPDVLNFNISYYFNNELKIAQGISNVYWHNTSDYLKNQAESFTRITFSPGDVLKYSAGAFISDRNPVSESEFDMDYFVILLSAGIEAKFERFIFSVELLDSHLGSSDMRKQTGINLSLDYIF